MTRAADCPFSNLNIHACASLALHEVGGKTTIDIHDFIIYYAYKILIEFDWLRFMGRSACVAKHSL